MHPCTSQQHSSSVKTRSARAILHRKLTSSSQHKRQGKMTDSLWLSPSGTSSGPWEGSEAPGPPLSCLHRHPARLGPWTGQLARHAGYAPVLTGEPRGLYVFSSSRVQWKNPCRIATASLFPGKSGPTCPLTSHISVSTTVRGGSAPHHPGQRAAGRGSSPLAAIVPSTRERCSSFWILVLGSSSHLPTRSCWAAGLRAVGCVPATSP